MYNRKIKVEIKADKVKEVLEKLNKDSNSITLDLDIEENKETYKYLSTSNDIISWDFIEETTEKKVIPLNPTIIKQEEEIIEVDTEEVINPIAISDYNEFATYVEAVWRVGRKSPTIKWGTRFFYKTLKDEYNVVASSPVSLEHALLVMVMQTYYRDVELNEAVNDTNSRLKDNWSKLKDHLSLASVSKALYEK